jgi:hypothetical protein
MLLYLRLPSLLGVRRRLELTRLLVFPRPAPEAPTSLPFEYRRDRERRRG